MTQSGPMATSGPMTAWGPIFTLWPNRAAGSTTAVGWISAALTGLGPTSLLGLIESKILLLLGRGSTIHDGGHEFRFGDLGIADPCGPSHFADGST